MRRSFRLDSGGVTAVEFAFTAPIFIYLALMVCQAGVYYYYTAALQKGLNSAVRQILVGNLANSTPTETQFLNADLCPQLPTFDCSAFVVNFTNAPTDFYSLTNKTANPSLGLGYSMSGLNEPPMDNTKTKFCIGGSGSVVVAQVFYPMPVIGIPAFAGATTYNGQAVMWVQASLVFKNEPFSTNYAGC